MAELSENRKSDVRVGSLRKGEDFFLGKRMYTNTLDMVSLGLSEENSMRFAEKYLEDYGQNLVIELEKLSKQELARRGFDDSVSSKLQRSFGYFIEKKTIYTLYVYLKYNDEWAPWARYIMGKTGTETHRKTGNKNGFRMSYLTDSHIYTSKSTNEDPKKGLPPKRKSRGWGKTYRKKPISKKTIDERQGKQNKPKYHQPERHVIPIKNKKGEVEFKTLPIGGSKGVWIHPAINRFNFIDAAFKEVDIIMERMLAEQRRKYYEKLRLK